MGTKQISERTAWDITHKHCKWRGTEFVPRGDHKPTAICSITYMGANNWREGECSYSNCPLFGGGIGE